MAILSLSKNIYLLVIFLMKSLKNSIYHKLNILKLITSRNLIKINNKARDKK